MGKLANISGKKAVKAFERAGWSLVGQVGSHCVLKKKAREPISQFLNTRSFLSEHCVH
jgi:predicted RNA binding protein YcfA (HicA-like mRNA interferase family)